MKFKNLLLLIISLTILNPSIVKAEWILDDDFRYTKMLIEEREDNLFKITTEYTSKDTKALLPVYSQALQLVKLACKRNIATNSLIKIPVILKFKDTQDTIRITCHKVINEKETKANRTVYKRFGDKKSYLVPVSKREFRQEIENNCFRVGKFDSMCEYLIDYD